MAGPAQYLRLVVGGQPYLLPCVLRYSVESQSGLVRNHDARLRAVAWRVVGHDRWPAYGLDANLNPVPRLSRWERALFLEGNGATVGLVIEEFSLLPHGEVNVTPFTPLGAPGTREGHLFDGARIEGSGVVLAFRPQALVSYLMGLGA